MAVGVNSSTAPEAWRRDTPGPWAWPFPSLSLKNFFRNVTGHRKQTDITTNRVPGQEVPERHRGLHRLMLRDDGQARCVHLHDAPDRYCRPAASPSSGRGAEQSGSRSAPKIFKIDELPLVCGLSAEACPCNSSRRGRAPTTPEPSLPARRRHPRQGGADVTRPRRSRQHRYLREKVAAAQHHRGEVHRRRRRPSPRRRTQPRLGLRHPTHPRAAAAQRDRDPGLLKQVAVVDAAHRDRLAARQQCARRLRQCSGRWPPSVWRVWASSCASVRPSAPVVGPSDTPGRCRIAWPIASHNQVEAQAAQDGNKDHPTTTVPADPPREATTGQQADRHVGGQRAEARAEQRPTARGCGAGSERRARRASVIVSGAARQL